MIDFKTHIKNMTFKDVVLAMVNGLRKRHVEIDMSVFARVDRGVCFGCAATNFICEVTGSKFTKDTIFNRELATDGDKTLLRHVEDCIEALRKGNVGLYNELIDRCGLPPAPDDYVPGPYLSTEYTSEELDSWEKSICCL